MQIKNRVFITSTSSICCAGSDDAELIKNIYDSNSGITIDNNYFFNSTPAIGKIKSSKTFDENLIIQCQNILDNSGIEDFNDTLLIIGSSVGGMVNTENSFLKSGQYKDVDINIHTINKIATLLNKNFNFYDDISFSTACTSSANAIGYGYEVLKKGLYKNTLVVGVDSLCKTTVGGFLSLGVLSSNPCKPFDKNRDGMNVSEAIGCLLLETKESKNCVEVCGVGYSSDAFHMTQPKKDGAITAMKNALKLADLNTDDINYINAHGTGTLANDTSESNAIEDLFKNNPYISSTKSITGHTLGASGAIEAIISKKIIENQIIPKSTALDEIENINIKFTNENISQNINYIVSNSFAFGGNNCSLVFGKVNGVVYK